MRRWNFTTILILAAASVLLLPRSSHAQVASIPWYTIDCGGGTSTSIDYDLQGTIAQFDAQGTLTGTNLELTGGYWNPGLEVTCPADFNNDGLVTVQDLFDFLQGWFGGCFAQSGPPCNGHNADFNHNGQITNQDLFSYLGAWFAKCPGY